MFRRRRKDLVCREAVELVTDYLEGALSPPEQARLESHLSDCPHCSEYLAQMRRTLDALGSIDAGALEPEVTDELVSLYRRWLAE